MCCAKILRQNLTVIPISPRQMPRRLKAASTPMRVQYVGEEAEDAGGVSKEFFLLLLMPDLLDP